jgi:hypothetical protein
MQGTFLPIRTSDFEMSVIFNGLAADVALEVSAGTGHFVATVDFYKWFGADVAFLDEGCRHGFFDDVLCGEFVFFFVLCRK